MSTNGDFMNRSPQNYARLQARTPWVAFVDVDMVVSSDLWRYAGKAAKAGKDKKSKSATKAAGINPMGDEQLQRDRKTAWVLPSFYIRCV